MAFSRVSKTRRARGEVARRANRLARCNGLCTVMTQRRWHPGAACAGDPGASACVSAAFHPPDSISLTSPPLHPRRLIRRLQEKLLYTRHERRHGPAPGLFGSRWRSPTGSGPCALSGGPIACVRSGGLNMHDIGIFLRHRDTIITPCSPLCQTLTPTSEIGGCRGQDRPHAPPLYRVTA